MNLRTARKIAKLTQHELAIRSGVDQRTISKIEKGKIRNPSWEKVAGLARALGVEPSEIFPIPEQRTA